MMSVVVVVLRGVRVPVNSRLTTCYCISDLQSDQTHQHGTTTQQSVAPSVSALSHPPALNKIKKMSLDFEKFANELR